MTETVLWWALAALWVLGGRAVVIFLRESILIDRSMRTSPGAPSTKRAVVTVVIYMLWPFIVFKQELGDLTKQDKGSSQ